MRIVFVCTGNMHRSPLAEGMLRQVLERDGRSDVAVTSAGVLGLEGTPLVAGAAKLARADGIDLSDHRSRALSAEHLAADLILAMEPRHIEEIASRDPAAPSRCRLLSEYADGSRIRPGEIVPDADPDSSAALRNSYEIIKDCVARLYRTLPPPAQEVYASAVEHRFREHRRTGIGLSPADYALVEDWWQREIPLWLVLESIDGALSRRESAVEERARSLRFCRREVERRFRALLRSRVPSGDETPREPAAPGAAAVAAARRLDDSAARARAEQREREAALLESAARDARGLVEGHDPASIQLELLAIERRLLDAFIELTPRGDLDAIRLEAVRALEDHRERMTEEAFARTVERKVAQGIRVLHSIPVIDG